MLASADEVDGGETIAPVLGWEAEVDMCATLGLDVASVGVACVSLCAVIGGSVVGVRGDVALSRGVNEFRGTRELSVSENKNRIMIFTVESLGHQ